MNIEKELITYFDKISNVEFAYLFGSYSKGDYNATSDVDIALYMNDFSLDTRLQINYELSKLLKKEVDLVILNEMKNLYLLESIFHNNILLKNSEKRLDFELLKEHDILDFKAFKKAMNAA